MSNNTPTGGSDDLFGTPGSDTIDGLGGDDYIQSLSGFDTLFGESGNDALDGDSDGDVLVGGTGNDSYVIDDGGDSIFENAGEGTDKILSYIPVDMSGAANVENIRLVGEYTINFSSSGAIIVTNNGSAALGNSLDNTLEGTNASDFLAGGTGDDTYIVHDLPGATITYVDQAGTLHSNIVISDDIQENTGEGNDTILFDPYVATATAYVLPNITATTEIENLTLGGSFKLNGTGNTGDNTLTGNSAVNILTGLDGNDTYVVQTTTDKVIEVNGTAGGIDTISCGFTYTLAKLANIENITLTGSANANATGNTAVNTLAGNDGVNILNGVSSPGGAGDTYVGSLGNDTYMIHSATDAIIADTNTLHVADGGTDLVISSVSYDLSANAATEDNLTLTGTLGLSGTGNALDNVITGNTGANVLDGGTGGIDKLIGGAGNDTLTVAGSGNDTLDGGTGADIMTGAGGNDTFLVDNYLLNSTTGDTVITGGAGQDTVKASVSFNMDFNATDVEALVLTGKAVIGYGNDLNNTITGSIGANTIHGGLGNDTIFSGGGADRLYGDDGNDTITGGSVTDTLDGGNGDDLLAGGGGNDTLIGGTGNDGLSGEGGKDLLIGGDGNDTYTIHDNTDTIVEAANGGTDTVLADLNFSLAALPEVENLTLNAGTIGTGNAKANAIIGNGGSNFLSGLDGNDTLTGMGGNDTLDGGTGDDTMTGGAGNDTFFVDSASDAVFNGLGTDTVFSSIDYTLVATTISNLTLTGNVAVSATGNTLDNILTGNSIANVLTGGTGNDTYVMDNTVDTISENGSEGKDLVMASVSFDLTSIANVEDITLTGAANINAIGNSLDNTLTGNAGINTLTGGDGNDTYVLGDQTNPLALDVIAIDSSGTQDTVSAGGNYDISARIDLENIILTGTGNFSATGNANANTITGNSGDNILDAGSSAGAGDTYIGSNGNDTYMVDETADVVVNPTVGSDGGTDVVIDSVDGYNMSVNAINVENLTLAGAAVTATGNGLDNVITGDSQNNILFGLGGNDVFRAGSLASVDSFDGGSGNDTYFVDNAGDVITETSGNGTDAVFASISYDMSLDATGEVENLTLTGAVAVVGIGNGSDNIVTGNGINNTLDGQAGNDTLDGGAGADSMIGGTGNDTFIVDSQLDVVIENAGEGTADLIKTNLTYVLSTSSPTYEVENLTLTGSANINGTGNDLDNTITGNGGINTLDGWLGADVLIGGGGNDVYMIDNSGDSVLSGSGTAFTSVDWDMGTNATSVGNLTVMGSAAVSIAGNALDNVITTSTGIDTVNGGAGNDTIYVHNASDVVTDVDSAVVHDTIIIDTASIGSAVSYDMMSDATNVNALTITGIGNFAITGNNAGDTITGNSGINQFIGGSGDDTFYVSANDFVVDGDLSGTDSDTIGVAFSVSLKADELLLGGAHWQGVEDILLTGTAALSAIGDTAANTITGNSGNDILDDGGVIIGSGTDTLIGGAGNDTYYVNNTADVVDEAHHSGAGMDIIMSTVSYDMSAAVSQGVEKLTLLGLAIVGTGNDSTNVILGTALGNTLNGEGGTDTMNGGLGDDTYYVDASDIVLDSGGIDHVVSSMHAYTLANNIEDLELSSALTAVSGTGNKLNNQITGNTLDNTLDGGIGANSMIGGDGNDTYYVDNLGDSIQEVVDSNQVSLATAGTHDLIISKLSWTLADSSIATNQVEDLTLAGKAAHGIGNDLDNHITGNLAANILVGSKGSDVLEGDGGSDVLYADSSPLGGNADTAGDFNTLDGGLGRDLLYCGGGEDTVVINPDATINVDKIYNFDPAQDSLLFNSALQGFDPLQNVIDDFVAERYDANTGNTNVYIDPDGVTVNGAHFLLAAIIIGVNDT